jgi:regulator of sirC expression with transglutaminase-like and TPR domain
VSTRSRRTFHQLITLPEGAIPLAESALLMACEEYPQLELSPYLDQLDEMATAVRSRMRPSESPLDTIRTINNVLFDEFGFRGNRDNYYDPRNSFLNDVLERRVGIPITLSTIYLEVARRLPFPIVGLGMPNHFLVKYADRAQEFILDPFNRGDILTRADCASRVAESYGRAVELSDRFFEAVTHRQILVRMLNNLKAIYVEARAYDKGLGMVEMLLLAEPANPQQYRDRGLLHRQLRHYELAARDLEKYIKLAPNAKDRQEVQEALTDVRRIQATMN